MDFCELAPPAISIARENAGKSHVAVRAPDHNEDLLMRILRNAQDLSVGSEELASHITNPYTMYHLSAARADLLRPLNDLIIGASILEIGAECGALTRYLGETGVTVTAVENDFQQASIAGERCRDLRNVRVLCEHFEKSSFPAASYDTILMIGNNPDFLSHERTLNRCRRLLRPDGRLIVAMSNKLGMQRWIEPTGSYPASPAMFSRGELKDLLVDAGYPGQQWYFPFPDYTFPSVTVHESAFSAGGFNAADVIKPYFCPTAHPSLHGIPEMVVPLLENKLMADMANAFLVMAGNSSPEKDTPPALAYTFNSTRRNGYKKSNTFLHDQHGIRVHKEKIFPGSPINEAAPVRQHFADETYLPGSLYSDGLTKLLSKPGWTMTKLFVWAHPFYRFLYDKAYLLEGTKCLDGKWIDATPFNLILCEKRRLEPIDLEWEINEPVPLDFVFFRGLYHCLLRMPGVSPPLFNDELSAFTLITELLRYFQRSVSHAAEQFIRLETRYFQEVVAVKPFVITDFLLPYSLPDAKDPPLEVGRLLPPFTATDIQIFTETPLHSFEEEHSVKRTIDLGSAIQSFWIPLPHEEEYPSKIRIDPSMKPGMMHFSSVAIWEDARCLYRWAPFLPGGRGEQMTDVLLLAAKDNPEPIMLLTGSDPMMIFSLPEFSLPQQRGELALEITLAALKDQDATDMLARIGRLSNLLEPHIIP